MAEVIDLEKEKYERDFEEAFDAIDDALGRDPRRWERRGPAFS